MRGRFLLIAPAVALVACDDRGGYGISDNEIVFSIGQRVDAASGKTEVTAGYEYLGLVNKGGWVSTVFRDADREGTCFFELYEHRLGPLQVESGVATWTGGKLPASGLQVLANQPDRSKHEGEGWGPEDILTFTVTGFAMPPLRSVRMFAPRVDLEVTAFSPSPVEGAGEVSLKATDDVGVTWTPTSRESATRVMVTLETEDDDRPVGGVRCFRSSESGTSVIPSAWVARLFSATPAEKPIKGHIAVYSHQQTTYFARSGWTTYIVATTEHRTQPFSGVR